MKSESEEEWTVNPSHNGRELNYPDKQKNNKPSLNLQGLCNITIASYSTNNHSHGHVQHRKKGPWQLENNKQTHLRVNK